MSLRTSILAILVAALALACAAPAMADGPIIITQAKALSGNITPGDAPGYPVTLTKPGAYRLESNLVPPANQNGIEIDSGFVTIDLNGYTLFGLNKATKGIVGTKQAASIRNGSITGFKTYGIYGGESWTLDNVLVVNNVSVGAALGDSARITHSTISGNGYIGLGCAPGCHVEGNIVSYNGEYPLSISQGSVLGNTITDNDGAAITASDSTGFANNTLAGNNGGYSQVYDGYGLIKMLPNACKPTCF